MKEEKKPVILFDKYLPLECHVCKRDLLTDFVGVIAFAKSNFHVVDDVYWTCKGKCDEVKRCSIENDQTTTQWEDIGDLVNPLEFQRWQMAVFNSLKCGDKFGDKAFNRIKEFILLMGQFVYREPTEQERKRYVDLDLTRGL